MKVPFMKFLSGVYIVLQLFSLKGFSQGQWVWMKGDSTKGNTTTSLNSYGVKGVPDPSNTPPKMYAPSSWNDQDGNLWLIGGNYYYDALDSWQPFTAFWKCNVQTNEWVWLKGTDGIGGVFEYGIKGIEDSSNYPGGRFGASTWVDHNGNFWFFGGNLTDITYLGLNDLWKYNTQNGLWTWMNGEDHTGDDGHYGTKGIADSANNPPSRWMAESWTDQQGNLWLFGGYRLGDNGDKYLNDLWKYEVLTNQWTWMNGSSQPNQFGVYGTLGVADSANTPGSRINNHLHWIDTLGNLYLFGGFTIEPNQGAFADLWKYDINANQWTWIGGDKFLYSFGNYNTPCIADNVSYPSSRSEATGWTDKDGNFWLFGGRGVLYFPGIFTGATNDLWKYNPYTNKWAWISGINDFVEGSYGFIGVPSESNSPKSRFGSVSWVDTTGNFWIFGGTTKYWNTDDRTLNDLWMYKPDTTCGVFTSVTTLSESKSQIIEISPNPVDDWLNIFYNIKEDCLLSLYDINGKQVASVSLFHYFKNRLLNVSELPPGVYLAAVSCKGERVWSEKVVMQH